jgi:hypothetical protein
MLNCKPGQNAIVVGDTDNLGKVGKCLGVLQQGVEIPSSCGQFAMMLFNGTDQVYIRHPDGSAFVFKSKFGALWEMSRDYVWYAVAEGVTRTIQFPVIPDVSIKPLLDIDGEDEMVELVGKPTHEKELETC